MCFDAIAGDTLLHTALAVEVMGGRQNPRANDGSGHRHLFGDREEAEKDAPARLSVGELTVRRAC